ncbi:glyceraldehyde-3-phosphate dehydrogenase [Halieaceae bacterium IMCC14734]|uniref:Glyceraldehyde-3-phosphate dehydrogenase n=1 Tax=Candidatus Litorirhabdus singularis TaxID=2518993 RepID=A0ABT3TFR0_9GAMM|nr:hypothetical protein [Candidatus Litorirhabdus singularis]MCX2980252.1 glyceraldehyde-3-phosphate dehydrogenase [Candidatus Litorirhabdus singularis]
MRRLVLPLLLLVSYSALAADSFLSNFIDPDDGWFDGSQFLLDYPYGVLPVPVVITEPAVGEGLGLAAVYFHDADPAWDGERVGEDGRLHPLSTSAVVAAATNNDSKIVGGGHFGHYKRDTLRYEGMVGAADINLKFYGLGDGAENSGGFGFNAKALFVSQQLAFRLGRSNWFVGGELQYTDMETKFKTGIDIPGLDTFDFDSTNVALGVLAFYDSLSNPYTPHSGVLSDVSYKRYDESLGGDFDYNLLDLKNQVHFTPWQSLAVGLRLDASFLSGDAPFWALPFISMRGIPALRYQGENVVTAEVQGAWSLHPRWQLLGFAGAGQATQDRDNLGDAETHVSYGAGFRYLAVRQLGLNMGLDVAKGPEETVWYVSFGTKFM